jgi:hypothetical protein
LKKYANGQNEFFFHVTSPFIFPLGTARKYGLERDLLKPPGFLYENPLPIPEKIEGGKKFERGMFVEVVDSYMSELVCPARVLKVLGPYAVRIRFIGWNSDYDQWKPVDSLDIFPIGWCELVGYTLTAAGLMDDAEEEDEFMPTPEVPSSSAGLVASEDLDSKSKAKSRRKSVPKKRVMEVEPLPAPPAATKTPKPRKSGKRKSQRKDSEDSDDSERAPSRKTPGSKNSIILIEPQERPVPDGARRSARARAAPEFFGANVVRRNSRNNYLE